jgi:hypothetical protein
MQGMDRQETAMTTDSLSRRDFFTHVGRLVVLLPAGAALVAAACGTDTPAACTDAGNLTVTATEITVTSSCASSHVHDFSILDTTLQNPPGAGVSGLSSADPFDQHVHTVALTQADLQMIQSGGTVTVTSGVTGTHTHDFEFRKA